MSECDGVVGDKIASIPGKWVGMVSALSRAVTGVAVIAALPLGATAVKTTAVKTTAVTYRRQDWWW